MSVERSWVLTDVDRGVYVEEATLTSDGLGDGYGRGWTVRKRRQIGRAHV